MGEMTRECNQVEPLGHGRQYLEGTTKHCYIYGSHGFRSYLNKCLPHYKSMEANDPRVVEGHGW